MAGDGGHFAVFRRPEGVGVRGGAVLLVGLQGGDVRSHHGRGRGREDEESEEDGQHLDEEEHHGSPQDGGEIIGDMRCLRVGLLVSFRN